MSEPCHILVDRGFIARALLTFMPTDMGSSDHDINDASVTVFTPLGTRSTQESWQRRCDLWRMSWLRLHTKMRRSCISGHSRCSNFVEILGCKGRWHEIHSPVSVPRSCPQCRLDNWLHLPLLVPLIKMTLEERLELRKIYINVWLSFLQQWRLTCGFGCT